MDAGNPDRGELEAKIVYFGPQESGTSTNVRYIYEKLRPEYRGDLAVHTLEGSPRASFECLPIELGRVRGRRTTLHLYTVPGGAAHAGMRRRLCSDAVGIVFVADLRPTRHRATAEALAELRGHLESAGRSLDDVVLILQYNRRDLADENAVDALHRTLDLRPSETFDAVASEGTGVLQTLTSLSKMILRRLRDADPTPVERQEAPIEPVLAAGTEAGAVEVPVAPGVEPGPDGTDKTLEIESAGPVEGTGGEVRLPLALVDPSTGRRFKVCLKLTLEPH